jgi:hypothetical protein
MEEKFWVIVYCYNKTNEEYNEAYDDFDDARADFIYMTQDEPEEYKYVVLQEVTEGEREDIEELEVWGDIFNHDED